jgi:pilus assembly protein CpaC
VVFSSASTLLSDGFATSATSIATSGSETFGFGVTNGTSAFFGVLEALRKDSMMKILADPTLVTVSGRAAYFHVGGKFPYLVPQGNNAISIDWMPYGTRVDFVPIVLGNGRIHLDVRPEVSEPDTSLSVTVNSSTIPGIRLRTAETGVEMSAGQTLAIAGLLSSRDEATNRGLPWVSELPYIGALFRRVEHSANDIELLILVTPELIEAVDSQDVPPCGPGMRNARPNDCDLYLRGHLEVPDCCSTCNGAGCDRCNHGQLPPPAAQEPGMILEATQSSTALPGKTNSVAAKQRRGITVDQVTTGGGVDDNTVVKTARPQSRVTRPETTITAPPPPQRPSTPTIIGPIGYEGK